MFSIDVWSSAFAKICAAIFASLLVCATLQVWRPCKTICACIYNQITIPLSQLVINLKNMNYLQSITFDCRESIVFFFFLGYISNHSTTFRRTKFFYDSTASLARLTICAECIRSPQKMTSFLRNHILIKCNYSP
jgi:hypothetical protein